MPIAGDTVTGRRWPTRANSPNGCNGGSLTTAIERARLTDKAHAKRFVRALLGDAFIIPSLGQGFSLPIEPPWRMPFIVKANHGCGQWIVVRNRADYYRARQVAPRWLSRSYGGWLDEWFYRRGTINPGRAVHWHRRGATDRL